MGDNDIQTKPLFVVEEQGSDGRWKPIRLTRIRFRGIVASYAPEAFPSHFRVRRVKTLEEARALNDPREPNLHLPKEWEISKWVA